MSVDSTRDQILSLIVTDGPINAARLASELNVTPAGVRRHLTSLLEAGHIAEHEIPGTQSRGRGRPSRSYVATPAGQRSLGSAYASVATDALDFLRQRGALDDFVGSRITAWEENLQGVVKEDAPLEERISQLSDALADQGYATSVRPGPGGYTVQLCQGHCPVQSIAENAPEWCEAETAAFSRLLNVHVQRLSTMAHGAHVCTTTIPMAPAKEGKA